MKRNRMILSCLLIAMSIVFAGCTNSPEEGQKPQENQNIVVKQGQKVKFTMQDGAEYVVELYPDKAPQTCANFVKLVKEGFYNGLTYHRIVENFMIQGGDPEGTGNGGSENPIKGEFSANGFTQNDLPHTEGVISMARVSNDYNSASSQFFICVEDCSFLDGDYAAFGKVIKGYENVKEISKTEVYGETPVETPVISKVELLD